MFLTVLIVAAGIGTAAVYSRTPVYRASASVLTVKPKAVNAHSAEADIEHVAIQERQLLGENLLGRLTARLGDEAAAPTVTQLRGMLSIVPVPETNLLELRAEGSDPQQLQRVVNGWAEAYEDYRAEEIATATGRTTAELEEQQARLDEKIAEVREQLAEFRRVNQIVGLERGDNRALASLQGLNQSLNRAREQLVDAQGHQAALLDADSRGETVAPDSQKGRLAELRLAVKRNQGRLEELEKKYTRIYIERDTKLKDVPGQVESSRRELAEALQVARQMAFEDAAQAVKRAQATVQRLQQQLVETQDQVQVFNDSYKEFSALEEKLVTLQQLQTENTEQLARIQVMNLEKFPPIQIVDHAGVPGTPIRPDYRRDLGLVLGMALLLALFCTWLVDYLNGRPRSRRDAPRFDVNIYNAPAAPALDVTPANPQLAQAQHRESVLSAPQHRALPTLPRELSGTQVQALLDAGEPDTNAHVALLLCGVSPYELPLLHRDSFDDATCSVMPGGTNARRIDIAPGAWRRIQPMLAHIDQPLGRLSIAELDRRLAGSAHTNRIDAPTAVNALTLWHTYVMHLVRQGIDPADLQARVGTIPPDMLDSLLHHAPPGGSRETAQVDFEYPALAY